MISRRQFLVFLTSFTAVFSTPRTVHGKPNELTALPETPVLYFHNGWILRIDDLVDNRIGE
jgi:hypothetical protein